MKDNDTDGIFKDFQGKVKNKSKTENESFMSKSLKKTSSIFKKDERSEEEKFKDKLELKRKILDEKYKRERSNIEEQRKYLEEGNKHNPIQHKQYGIERVAYLAIILILVSYIAVDFGFYHNTPSLNVEENSVSGKVVQEKAVIEPSKEEVKVVEKSVIETAPEKEEVVEEAKAPVKEKPLKGNVALQIDEVVTSISENDDELGYIDEIKFTISNGATEILRPSINVYAYDNTLDDFWETKIRGTYTNSGIAAGTVKKGSIKLSPKSFRNLNVDKTVRLQMNDTSAGYLASKTKTVEIS
ncbi:hypothetical protein ISS07_05395 [Candidatus Woesearchaeota archaeon]|nr:hypothetical protein [Candidatus Woesearchaeota archaeon]